MVQEQTFIISQNGCDCTVRSILSLIKTQRITGETGMQVYCAGCNQNKETIK